LSKFISCKINENSKENRREMHLFKDARQLRCGHSFCYQCILTTYDRLTDKIVCPRCQFVSFYYYLNSMK